MRKYAGGYDTTKGRLAKQKMKLRRLTGKKAVVQLKPFNGRIPKPMLRHKDEHKTFWGFPEWYGPGEYGKLAQSAVSTAKLAINQQKKDGIIAQPPSGIVRANSLSDAFKPARWTSCRSRARRPMAAGCLSRAGTKGAGPEVRVVARGRQPGGVSISVFGRLETPLGGLP